MTDKKTTELAPSMIKIIDAISAIMEEKGVSQRALALDAGIDEGNLSRILNKKRNVTMERLFEILEYLEYDIVFVPKTEK